MEETGEKLNQKLELSRSTLRRKVLRTTKSKDLGVGSFHLVYGLYTEFSQSSYLPYQKSLKVRHNIYAASLAPHKNNKGIVKLNRIMMHICIQFKYLSSAFQENSMIEKM